METYFSTLCSVLEKERPILIQAHDFPDHDAIGAAYALSELLKRFGFRTELGYGGLLQGLSILEFINYLAVPLIKIEELKDLTKYQVIIVDGSPFNGAVKKIGGVLKAVIDHHPPRAESTAKYTDIRPEIGSCSSIIWSYWQETGEIYDKLTATALIAGIQLDTNFLSRRVTKLDMDAYYELYFKSDTQKTQQILKVTFNVQELEEIGKAFEGYERIGGFLLVELKEDYSSALLSVVADFLIWIKDISFVIVIETYGDDYKLSARSRDKALDAGCLIQEVLKTMGSGGGHAHMAGGVILADKYPGKTTFLNSIVKLANSE